jgi:hypothetical protein
MRAQFLQRLIEVRIARFSGHDRLPVCEDGNKEAERTSFLPQTRLTQSRTTGAAAAILHGNQHWSQQSRFACR